MSLSDSTMRAAKPGEKDRKLTDEKGLYLLVRPTGAKLWRLKYRFGGQEKKLVLGSYPEISLKEARLKAEDARRQVLNGVGPSTAKRLAAIARQLSAEASFGAIAKEGTCFKVSICLGPRPLCAPIADIRLEDHDPPKRTFDRSC